MVHKSLNMTNQNKKDDDPSPPEKIHDLSYLSPYIETGKPKPKPIKKVFTLQIKKKEEVQKDKND